VVDGNDVFGRITQNSPVTYVAPDSLPSPATVEVRAVSREDTTKYDSCLVTVTFKVIHVNIGSGNDDTGSGYAHNPVKTITRGMELASSGGKVLVAPGLYDTDHGETFPIYPKAGVTLEGENWNTCIIRGADQWGYATSLGSSDSAIRKFTFESSIELGNERWEEYIFVRGDNVWVDSVRSSDRLLVAPIKVRKSTNAIIENCVFAVTYEADPQPETGNNWGCIVIDGNEGTVIRNCTFSGWGEGIRISDDNDTLIENCAFEGNDYGLYLCCDGSTRHNPNPDLGGGARGGTGGNVIENNVLCGLHNETTNVIYAKYNTWTNDPPLEGEDFCNVEPGGGVEFE
jgi:hypothetical protein